MSAAQVGIAENSAATITGTITPQRTSHGCKAVMRGLFTGGVAPLDIDVVIPPGMLFVNGVLEPLYPGLHQNVLVAVGVIHPRRVRIDELGHATEQARAFGAFGQLLRLFVELVELGQIETGKIVDTGVRA